MQAVLTNTGELLLQQSWQIAVVFVLVAIACWLLRRASAHWRYLLWLVVLAKCLVPPVLQVPVAVLPASLGDGPRAIPTQPAAHRPAAETPAPPPSELSEWENRPLATGDEAAAPEEPDATAPSAATPTGDAVKAARPAAPDEAATSSPWLWVTRAWLVGSGMLLLTLIVRAVRHTRRLHRARRLVTRTLARDVATVTERVGLHQPPRAWQVPGVHQPFIWGLWRGAIYLPEGFETLPTNVRRQILAHELAHVARLDAAINTLQLIVQSLLFFHPLVWWANRSLRREREKCCDEVAIAALASTPRRYGAAILDALLRDRPGPGTEPSLAVAGPARNIEDRIRTVLARRGTFQQGASRLAKSASLLLALLVLPAGPLLVARSISGPSPADRVGSLDSEHARMATGEAADLLERFQQLALREQALRDELADRDETDGQPAKRARLRAALEEISREQAVWPQRVAIERETAGDLLAAARRRRNELLDAAGDSASYGTEEQVQQARQQIRKLDEVLAQRRRRLESWEQLAPGQLRYVAADPRLAIWRRALYYMPPDRSGRIYGWASGEAEVHTPAPDSGVSHPSAIVLEYAYSGWDIDQAIDALQTGDPFAGEPLAGANVVRLDFNGEQTFTEENSAPLVAVSETRYEYGPAEMTVPVDGRHVPIGVRGVYRKMQTPRWDDDLLRYTGIEAYLTAEGLVEIGKRVYPVRLMDSSQNQKLGDAPQPPQAQPQQPGDAYFMATSDSAPERPRFDPYFSGDTLVIDLSPEGAFADPNQMISVWYGQPFRLEERMWQVRLSDDGRSLAAEEFPADQVGQLGVSGAAQWYAVLVGEEYVLNVASEGTTAYLPAGTYRIQHSGVKPGEEARLPSGAALPREVNVQPGAVKWINP